MIDEKKVIKIVKSLGRFDDEVLANYRCVIDSAVSSVFSSLSDEKYATDKRIEFLAGAKAYYLISLAEFNSDGVTSFSAGDIQIERDDDFIKSIISVYENAKNDCNGLIKDDCFAFFGV